VKGWPHRPQGSRQSEDMGRDQRRERGKTDFLLSLRESRTTDRTLSPGVQMRVKIGSPKGESFHCVRQRPSGVCLPLDARNPAAAKDLVSIVEDRSLPWRDSALGCDELHNCFA
jgi:hypothetical protein